MKPIRALAAAVFALALLAPRAALSDRGHHEDTSARVGAWDRSVALEAVGKTDEAREVLVRGWGTMPNNSYVAVRLGWLALRAREFERAASLYRKARTLPGATQEASSGLASALTGLGYERLARSEHSAARDAFEEALSIDPTLEGARAGIALLTDQRLRLDGWVGYLDKTLGSSHHRGAAGFAHVVWPWGSRFGLRLAYRYTQLQEVGTFRFSADIMGRSLRWSSHEVYAAITWNQPNLGFEVMPLVMVTSDETIWGAAARARVGRRVGVMVDGAFLQRSEVWSAQTVPMAFAWPTKYLGLHAGARITVDWIDTSVSWTGGASFVVAPVALVLGGHLGNERWPVMMGAPAVLTLGETLEGGLMGSALYSVTDNLRVGVVGSYERTRVANLRGSCWSMSAGISYSPPL